jgi:hypothetical protein
MTTRRDGSQVAMTGWDPTTPAALRIMHHDGSGNESLREESLFSHVGASTFYPFEFQALIRVIQAYEDHIKDPARQTLLSLKCRAAVLECIAAWTERVDPQDEVDRQNLALMQSVYSVMHLSDVFLPLLQSHLGVASDFSYRDLYEQPGRATADMVRCLRFTHMMYNLDLNDEFLTAAQPEKLGDTYWKHMYAMVLRGKLEDAWLLMQRHSLYTHTMAANFEDDSIADAIYETREAFGQLRELLMRAPLPGGRTDQYDNGLSARTVDVESTNFYLDDLETQVTDYRYWEPATDYINPSMDVPFSFQPEAAQRQHHVYQDYVRRFRYSFKLTRRIPELNKVLDILQGDLSKCEFDGWSDHLCAELLYKTPSIRPRQIGIRARQLMTLYDVLEKNGHLELLLNIMEGSAGESIHLMYKLSGESGAALPTTVTTVLFYLYAHSNILPPSPALRQSDFFREAGLAIVSSCSIDHADMGIVLALRLLVPFVLETGNRGVLSLIPELLDRRLPTSSAELQSIIDLCLPLIERKSLQILDACASIMQTRFRYCIESNLTGDGMCWLLRGIKLEEKYSSTTEGSSRKQLARYCYTLTDSVLNVVIAKDAQGMPAVNQAKEALEEVYRTEGFDMSLYPELLTLERSVSIFNAVVMDNDMGKAAESIVACLDTNLKGDMSVGCAAPSPFHQPLLQIAKEVLTLTRLENTECPFNRHGIDVLQSTLVSLHSLSQATKAGSEYIKYVKEMQELLASSLSLAIIQENKALRRKPVVAKDQMKGVYTCTLSSFPIDVQEKYVQSLLSPW